jgi:hypothetical protein
VFRPDLRARRAPESNACGQGSVSFIASVNQTPKARVGCSIILSTHSSDRSDRFMFNANLTIPDSCMHSPSDFPSRALHLAQCISNHMATRQGLLNPIGLDLIKFRTSLYADDVMLFLRPIASNVINLQLLLQQFGKATGLCINVQKSEIM